MLTAAMFIPVSSRPSRYLRCVAFALLCLGVTNACAEDITVSAAASLTDAFNALGRNFEGAHPGTHVVFNFAASDVLLKQIEQGAPADVFASADEVTMDRAAAAKSVDPSTRRDFAANTLVLIVPTNATPPKTLAELKTVDHYRHIAIGNPDSVPAGRYAKQALGEAGLWEALQPQFVQAQNVRQALDYVSRGEADAGFVYATDAAMKKDKVAVALTVPTATPVRYPIALVSSSQHGPLARAFVAFMLSADAQTTLRTYGFSTARP